MHAVCAGGLVDDGVAVVLQLLNLFISASLVFGDRVLPVPFAVPLVDAETASLVAC